MPTYSYRCSDCGHNFDIKQTFQDAALTVCPECNGRLHKEYGSVGITFKGSGFYRTDSRSGSKRGTSSTSSSSITSGSSKTSEKASSPKSTST